MLARTSLIGKTNPVGAPFLSGMCDRDRWVLAMQMGNELKPWSQEKEQEQEKRLMGVCVNKTESEMQRKTETGDELLSVCESVVIAAAVSSPVDCSNLSWPWPLEKAQCYQLHTLSGRLFWSSPQSASKGKTETNTGGKTWAPWLQGRIEEIRFSEYTSLWCQG